MRAASLFVCVLLCACAPAVTDGQAASVVARCKELGLGTRIFNSMLVSTVECVPVEIARQK